MTPEYPPHNNKSREELKNFLERIWRYESKLAQCYTIMIIDEGIPLFKHFCLDEFGNSFKALLSAVADYVEQYRSWHGAHIYYQVLPLAHRPERGRGTAQDVAVAKVAFADFDFKEPLRVRPAGRGEKDCKEGEDHELDCIYKEGNKWFHVKRPSLSKFLEQLAAFAEPSVVVDSGNGYHVYYFLDEEIDAEKFKRLQERLVDALGADPQAKDLARILRLPTTLNPRTNRICRVIYESNKRYSYDELKQKLLELQQKSRTQEMEPPQLKEPRKDTPLRELDSVSLKRLTELLKPIYIEGYRQSTCLYLTGWAAKARISPMSIALVIRDIHEATNDEEPLAKRLQALSYSYVKAGIDLAPYISDIERATGVKLKPPDPRVIGEIELKGRAGIQEVLEQVVQDDDKILSTIQELTEIFGTSSPFPGDSIFAVLDEARGIYAVADYRRMKMGQARLDSLDGKGKIKLSPIVTEVVPTRIIIYKNPFNRAELFEIWFDGPGLKGRDPPLKVGPVFGDGITAMLEERRLIKSTRDMFDRVFNAVLMKLIELGRIEIKEMLPQSGVFLSRDGKMMLSKYEIHEIDKEKLRAALQLLNELADRYSKKKFATIVKWAAAAPFGFMRKQLGYWTRWIFLHGNSRTGKSTLGRIALHLWGLKTALDPNVEEERRHERTASGGNTPARLGTLLNSTTFPILLNEAEDIFMNPSVVAMVKGAIDSDYARGIIERGKYRDFFSMASIILTSNVPFMKQLDSQIVEPLSRKMIVMTFNILEKVSDRAEKEFNEKYRPRLPLLREVGNCIMNMAFQLGVSFFDREISELELGKELLKKCYEAADMPIPPWLDEEYNVSESSLQELHFTEQFRNSARLAILRAYYNHYARMGHDVNIPLEERLKKAIIEELVEGLNFRKTYEVKGENDMTIDVEGDVIITRTFLNTIELNIELSSLAHALGWKYTSVRVPKPSSNTLVGSDVVPDWMRVVTVDLKKFISFLLSSPIPEELSAAENSPPNSQGL